MNNKQSTLDNHMEWTYLIDNPNELIKLFTIPSKKERENAHYVFLNADFDKYPALRNIRLKVHTSLDMQNMKDVIIKRYPNELGKYDFIILPALQKETGQCPLRKIEINNNEVRAVLINNLLHIPKSIHMCDV